jgi:dihydrofolate reductase
MSNIVVINHLTLDGVMQGPGRADEDTRNGFTHGGWAAPRTDDVMMQAIGARLSEGNRLLLGRRSYEDMLGYWNNTDSPFKEALNSAEKYVASRSMRAELPWPNSKLIHGDVGAAVEELKRQPGANLHIMGSGELIQTLLRDGLIDEYLLMIHPVVLGGGRRLFPDGGVPASLRLADSRPTTTGVILATYLTEASPRVDA